MGLKPDEGVVVDFSDIFIDVLNEFLPEGASFPQFQAISTKTDRGKRTHLRLTVQWRFSKVIGQFMESVSVDRSFLRSKEEDEDFFCDIFSSEMRKLSELAWITFGKKMAEHQGKVTASLEKR